MSFEKIWNWLVEFYNSNFMGILEEWGPTGYGDPEILNWDSIGYWIGFFVFFSIVACFILSRSKFIEKLTRHILILSVIVWFLGVVVYIVGFYNDGVNGVSVVLRAIVSSFKMFVVSHDLARIPNNLLKDPSYMAAFSVLHFAAAFITFLFIFKMIGYKTKSSLKLIHRRIFNCKSKEVHLFWGVNEASLLLAEDISECSKKNKSGKPTIIFVDVDEETEDNSQTKVTLSHIVNTITIKNSEISRLEAIGAYVDHCYNGPAAFKGDNETDIFGNLHLKSIGSIVRKCRKAYFYFLSNDEAQNIAGALNLQKDSSLRLMNDNKPVIYIHARRDANNEVFDHYSQYDGESQRMKIKIVDSAYLSVATLKQDDKTLPVDCVKIDKSSGVVESSFTALIVGFGETGQEAFKFLYEYSAFIDSDNKKSPFKCYAIDEHMDKKAGFIRKNMPAICENELSLIQASVDSEAFWDKVKDIITELNYVVISLNNDSLGLSLAVNLFKYALRNRQANQSILKILVRCYDNGNEKRMTEVVSSLNKSIEERFNVEIRLFGQEKKLYSYETIISDKVLEKAMEFHKIYSNSVLPKEVLWNEDFGYKGIEKSMKKNKMSRYHAIYDINRKIEQNISNAIHIRTKMILMGFGENEQSERLDLFYAYANSRKDETTKYDCSKEEEQQLLLNIAKVEHERWIASHKLMGFTYGKETDIVEKHHKDMCSFDELDEKTQSYDCNTVDTSIKLEHENS